MPSSALSKGIRAGYLAGETGWGDEMNDNLRRLNAYAVEHWAHDVETTVGLTYGHRGGPVLDAGGLVIVPKGTVALAASSTNYVERERDSGVVSVNQVGFTPARVPMAIVTTSSGAVTNVTDVRTLSTIGPLGDQHFRNVEIETNLEFLSGASSIQFDTALSIVSSTTGIGLSVNEDGDVEAAGDFTADSLHLNASGGITIADSDQPLGGRIRVRADGDLEFLPADGAGFYWDDSAGNFMLRLKPDGTLTTLKSTNTPALDFDFFLGGVTKSGLMFKGGNHGFLDFDTAISQVRLSGRKLLFGVNDDAAYAALAFTEMLNVDSARVLVKGGKNLVVGEAVLAGNVTNGFLYIPRMNAQPSGVPTAYTGTVAMVYDASNRTIWIYDGAWRDFVQGGGGVGP